MTNCISPSITSTTQIKGEANGFTRLPDGRVVGNRAIDYCSLTPGRLNALLARDSRQADLEPLKDYKWLLLHDRQSADEKGFMRHYRADGGSVTGFINKFWLVNIDERIRSLGGNPQDMTNNPLALEQCANIAETTQSQASEQPDTNTAPPFIAPSAESAIVRRLRAIADDVESLGTNKGTRPLDVRWAEGAIKRLLSSTGASAMLSGKQYGPLASAKIALSKGRQTVERLRTIADKLEFAAAHE